MTELQNEIANMKQTLSEFKKNVSLYNLQLNTVEAIWDNIPAIMFYKDKLNNLVRVNNYFCKVMNCKREDVEGKNILQLMKNEEQAAKYAANDIDVIRTGVAKLGIFETLLDTEIKLRTDKFPIIMNGKIEGVLGFSVVLNN